MSNADIDLSCLSDSKDMFCLSYEIERVTDWGPIYHHICKDRKEYNQGFTPEIMQKAKETKCTHVMLSLPDDEEEKERRRKLSNEMLDRIARRLE